MSEICEKELPELDQEVSNAVIALSPWFLPPSLLERRIASAEPLNAPADEEKASSQQKKSSQTVEFTPLLDRDRKSWELWTEERLKRVQYYMDITDDQPGLKEAKGRLSNVANLLVTFHGYASVGNVQQMKVVLEQVRSAAEKAEIAACGDLN